jgi:hypothetical protein
MLRIRISPFLAHWPAQGGASEAFANAFEAFYQKGRWILPSARRIILLIELCKNPRCGASPETRFPPVPPCECAEPAPRSSRYFREEENTPLRAIFCPPGPIFLSKMCPFIIISYNIILQVAPVAASSPENRNPARGRLLSPPPPSQPAQPRARHSLPGAPEFRICRLSKERSLATCR